MIQKVIQKTEHWGIFHNLATQKFLMAYNWSIKNSKWFINHQTSWNYIIILQPLYKGLFIRMWYCNCVFV